MTALQRPHDDAITGEQAALRRVATLVARAAPPEKVFAAVTAEAGRLLGSDHTTMGRYEPDGARTIVAAWSSTGAAFPVGSRERLGGRNVSTMVYQTGRAARIDANADASGTIADAAREFGFRGAVGVPVSVEGRLWGLVIAASRAGPQPAGIEARLAAFTELAATAIANAQARVDLREFAEEQAALRRVATLVARGTPPGEVFAAVAAEVGRLLGVDFTFLSRYSSADVATIVGVWARAGTAGALSAGSRWRIGARDLHTMVFQTHRPTRINDYTGTLGPLAQAARGVGLRSAVAVPISVEGHVWGAMIVGSTREERLPAGTEARLAGFTELAATAIANTQARSELSGFADEQAALRRVATLVAHGAPPEEVLAAVTEEAGRLLGAQHAMMSRYGSQGAMVGASWSSSRIGFPIGTQWIIGGLNLHTIVFQTHRPARIDDMADASGPGAEARDLLGVRSGVAVPISAGGRLWGVMIVGSTMEEPLPADTERKLAGFTELAATAIANAESQAALATSRARIVATADQTRRRIERDLHDGAQQRLVSLVLQLREARTTVPSGAGELAQQLEDAVANVNGVLEELRETARGLHPAILAEGGLRTALAALARRSAVPVRLDVQMAGHPPEEAEIAAYYVAAEALTNTAKHAHATTVDVQVTASEDLLRVRVSDDGLGGADFARGSGLIGLRDRTEALGGHFCLHSPPGAGTVLEIALPLRPAGPRPPTTTSD